MLGLSEPTVKRYWDYSASILPSASWSADGDVIFVGWQWQTWRAPSWEIAATEATEKMEGKANTLKTTPVDSRGTQN